MAEAFGHRVERLADVGVAGHSPAAGRRAIGSRQADVVIVVAGMEGALPSVVGGLVAVPGDRGADQRGLRRLVRRARGAAGDAQLLRGRGHGGQHRQRLRRRGGGQPDLPRDDASAPWSRQPTRASSGSTWCDPTREELSELVARLRAPSPSVNDCLDPEHLPKFEVFDDHTFVILRALDADAPRGCRHRPGADPEARRLRGVRVRDHDPSDGPAVAHGAPGTRARQRAAQARHPERRDPGPSPDPAVQRRGRHLPAPAGGGRD